MWPLSLNDVFFFFISEPFWKVLYPTGFYLLLLVLWPKSSIHVFSYTRHLKVPLSYGQLAKAANWHHLWFLFLNHNYICIQQLPTSKFPIVQFEATAACVRVIYICRITVNARRNMSVVKIPFSFNTEFRQQKINTESSCCFEKKQRLATHFAPQKRQMSPPWIPWIPPTWIPQPSAVQADLFSVYFQELQFAQAKAFGVGGRQGLGELHHG